MTTVQSNFIMPYLNTSYPGHTEYNSAINRLLIEKDFQAHDIKQLIVAILMSKIAIPYIPRIQICLNQRVTIAGHDDPLDALKTSVYELGRSNFLIISSKLICKSGKGKSTRVRFPEYLHLSDRKTKVSALSSQILICTNLFRVLDARCDFKIIKIALGVLSTSLSPSQEIDIRSTTLIKSFYEDLDNHLISPILIDLLSYIDSILNKNVFLKMLSAAVDRDYRSFTSEEGSNFTNAITKILYFKCFTTLENNNNTESIEKQICLAREILKAAAGATFTSFSASTVTFKLLLKDCREGIPTEHTLSENEFEHIKKSIQTKSMLNPEISHLSLGILGIQQTSSEAIIPSKNIAEDLILAFRNEIRDENLYDLLIFHWTQHLKTISSPWSFFIALQNIINSVTSELNITIAPLKLERNSNGTINQSGSGSHPIKKITFKTEMAHSCAFAVYEDNFYELLKEIIKHITKDKFPYELKELLISLKLNPNEVNRLESSEFRSELLNNPSFFEFFIIRAHIRSFLSIKIPDDKRISELLAEDLQIQEIYPRSLNDLGLTIEIIRKYRQELPQNPISAFNAIAEILDAGGTKSALSQVSFDSCGAAFGLITIVSVNKHDFLLESNNFVKERLKIINDYLILLINSNTSLTESSKKVLMDYIAEEIQIYGKELKVLSEIQSCRKTSRKSFPVSTQHLRRLTPSERYLQLSNMTHNIISLYTSLKAELPSDSEFYKIRKDALHLMKKYAILISEAQRQSDFSNAAGFFVSITETLLKPIKNALDTVNLQKVQEKISESIATLESILTALTIFKEQTAFDENNEIEDKLNKAIRILNLLKDDISIYYTIIETFKKELDDLFNIILSKDKLPNSGFTYKNLDQLLFIYWTYKFINCPSCRPTLGSIIESFNNTYTGEIWNHMPLRSLTTLDDRRHHAFNMSVQEVAEKRYMLNQSIQRNKNALGKLRQQIIEKQDQSVELSKQEKRVRGLENQYADFTRLLGLAKAEIDLLKQNSTSPFSIIIPLFSKELDDAFDPIESNLNQTIILNTAHIEFLKQIEPDDITNMIPDIKVSDRYRVQLGFNKSVIFANT